jgi:hypothetical protein
MLVIRAPTNVKCDFPGSGHYPGNRKADGRFNCSPHGIDIVII